jgi:hypothetical protein
MELFGRLTPHTELERKYELAREDFDDMFLQFEISGLLFSSHSLDLSYRKSLARTPRSKCNQSSL